MDKYTASNGIGVRIDSPYLDIKDGVSWRGIAGSREVIALREFFQAERDEELGRWRWPENPDYVVYQHESGQAIVINERTGISFYRYRGEAAELREMRAGTDEDVSLGTKAAEAYFDAHPERQPWDDAKPGEAWRLKEVDAYPGIAIFTELHVWLWSTGSAVDLNRIVEGHRIWPEPD